MMENMPVKKPDFDSLGIEVKEDLKEFEKNPLIYRITLNVSSRRASEWYKRLMQMFPYISMYRFFDDLMTDPEKANKHRGKHYGSISKPEQSESGIISIGFTHDNYWKLMQLCYERGMVKSHGLVMMACEILDDFELTELARKWLSRMDKPNA